MRKHTKQRKFESGNKFVNNEYVLEKMKYIHLESRVVARLVNIGL